MRLPRSPLARLGNEARAQLYGPPQRSADFSLFKEFRTPREDEAAVSREVYNITNTENFGQPNVTITKWSSTLPGFNTGAPGATPVLGAARVRPDHRIESGAEPEAISVCAES